MKYIITALTALVIFDEILALFFSWRVMLFPFAAVLFFIALWWMADKEDEEITEIKGHWMTPETYKRYTEIMERYSPTTLTEQEIDWKMQGIRLVDPFDTDPTLDGAFDKEIERIKWAPSTTRKNQNN